MKSIAGKDLCGLGEKRLAVEKDTRQSSCMYDGGQKERMSGLFMAIRILKIGMLRAGINEDEL